MMPSHDLHPLAREALAAFAAHPYFRSLPFTNALAERDPAQCIKWALNLVERFVSRSTRSDDVTRTLSAIRRAIADQSANDLLQLDELSWQSWSSGPFDEAAPFAQRAVARLGWASILLIEYRTGTCFESRYTGLHIAANTHGMIRELANQCGMAVDMIYTDTNDGRLMVAASFSHEMAATS